MAAMSDWLEEHLLDHNLNANALAVAVIPVDGPYLSLHTADPTDANVTSTEVSTGDYARADMSSGTDWTIATAAGVTTARNNGAVSFPQETQFNYPGPVTHFGVFNAPTSGQLMYHGAVSPNTTQVTVGDTPSFADGALILEAQDAFSDYLELENLKHTLNGAGNAIAPASVHVALWIGDPGDTGATGTEVTGGSYAREQMTAGWTLDGTGGLWKAENTGIIDFGTTTAAWGTVTHFAIWNHTSAGDLFYHSLLTNPKPIADGDSVTFPAGTLSIELQ